MNEFLKISWGISGPHELEHGPEFLSEDVIKDSYVYSNTKEMTNDLMSDNETEKNFRFLKFTPGRDYRFNCDIESKLNNFEQGNCLKALIDIQSGKQAKTLNEKKNAKLYNRLQQTIRQEQINFLEFAKKDYMDKVDTFRMNPTLARYGTRMWRIKLRRCLKYARYYGNPSMLSYFYSETDVPIEIIHEKLVKEVGIVGKFTLPVLYEKCILKINTLPKQPEKSSKVPVSEDLNINDIVESNLVDVVISSGALRKLLDFTQVNASWFLPIVVKSVIVKRDGNSDVNKNVVFIDKPLPKLNPNLSEITEWCFKLMLKTNFCNAEGIKFPGENLNVQTGTGMQDTTQVKSETNKHVIHENFTYRIWKLQQKNEFQQLNPMDKMTYMLPSFKVLIRNKVDSYEATNGTLIPLTIVPKLEYQLALGGSVSSKAELLKEWMSLYFKPYSQLYRVRTHFRSNEVIMFEKCNIQMINNEASTHYKHKFCLALGVLYKIFYDLTKLPPGSYVLRHLPKHGPFVELLEEVNTESTLNKFDLHEEFNLDKFNFIENYDKNWHPIDTNLILPTHRTWFRFPATFHPNKRKYIKKDAYKKMKCKKKNKKKLKKKKASNCD